MAEIIAIDYGLTWCGLARSSGELAEPLPAVKKPRILAALKKLRPTLIIVGISEGAMAAQTLTFAKWLSAMLHLPVETADETLSSVEAARWEKDKQKQHSVAAALILTRYLDNEKGRNV